MAHRYMNAVERETQRPFNETKGRTNNPYITTPGRQSNQNNTPGRQTEVSEPRRGGNHQITTDQPGRQTKGNIEPSRQTEVNEPRRGNHQITSDQPGNQGNQHNVITEPSRNPEIQPQQPVRDQNIERPSKKWNTNEGINQQPSRQFQQPSRQIEPSRSPSFEHRGIDGSPRGGSSSCPSGRPRR
jgi:hypothetical protein